MKGDFNSGTFDPSKHFVGVPMQEGPIREDSDSNERVCITLNLLSRIFISAGAGILLIGLLIKWRRR